MHVLVTGASGFVGRALARRLATDARLGNTPIDRLSLLDLSFDDPPLQSFVRHLAGDMGDAAWLRRSLAEQQYELARRVNLDATTVLLESGNAQVEAGGRAPLFVFASTIGVFGMMPVLVTDETLPRPLMTYGAH